MKKDNDRSELGKIGVDAITNQKSILDADVVQASAMVIAGDGAVVLAMKEGYVYIKSEDGSVVHRVAVGENLENLSDDILFSKDDTVMFRASESLKNLFPGRDVSQYEDTYVALNKQTLDGKTVATSDIVRVVPEGVEVTSGHTVETTIGRSNSDTMVALALLGNNAAVPNREGYTVSAPSAQKTEADNSKS